MAVTKTTSFSEPALTDAMITNNYSTLTINIYFSPNNTVTWFQTATLYCSCNGSNQSQNVSLSTGGSVSASFTFTNIGHDSDGSKSVSWSWSCATGTSVLGTISDSGTRTLQTIPRASQPTLSASNVNLGSSVTITTNRKSSSFTHTLSYSIGRLTNQTSGLVASSGVGASTTFTPPSSLAEQFPNATSGTVIITCKTYNGSTLLGTKTCTLTVKTIDNSTYKPTMTLTATGSNLFNSKILNNKSGVTIAASNSAKLGASINSYQITGLSKSSSNANLVVSLISTSMSSATTTITFSGSVVDSRGYSNTASTSITVYRYNSPKITSFSIQRCESNGTVSNSGTYALVNWTYTYQNDGYSNSITIKKIHINNTDYTLNATETTSNGVVTGTGSTVIGGGNFNVNSHYDYTVTLKDAVGSQYNITGTLPTSSKIINVRPGGKGIAFGKFAETDNLVDSQWDIKAPNFTGDASNAKKIYVENNNPSSDQVFYPIFVSNSGDNQTTNMNNGLFYSSKQGTTSAVGMSYLIVGNPTASGTAGNKKGMLQLYGQNSGRAQVEYANSTTNVTQVLPALSGTMVVKQSANITTETNGWYKVNMGAYTHYFKTGSIPSQKYNLNGWGWLTGTWKNLPSGVTYNSAKMIFTGNVYCEDSAILYNWGIVNGNTAVNVYYNNKYGGDLTKVGYYNFSLIVFP